MKLILCHYKNTKLMLQGILVNMTVLFLSTFISINSAYAISSQYEYENKVTDELGIAYLTSIQSCDGMVMSFDDLNDMYNVVMRNSMSENPSISASDRALITIEIVMPIIARRVAYGALASTGIGSILVLMAITADVLVMLDVCTNIYVIQPHEYANYNLGGDSFMSVAKVNGKFINNAPCAANAEDVPYFFQCDDHTKYGYDPDLCSAKAVVYEDSCECRKAAGRDFYIKPPKYCYAMPSHVGELAFTYDSNILTRFWNDRTRYQPMNSVSFVKPNGGV